MKTSDLETFIWFKKEMVKYFLKLKQTLPKDKQELPIMVNESPLDDSNWISYLDREKTITIDQIIDTIENNRLDEREIDILVDLFQLSVRVCHKEVDAILNK